MSCLSYLFCLWTIQAVISVSYGQLVNTRVERTLDLTSQLAIDVARVTLLNQDSAKTVEQFVIAVPDSLAKHVAHVSASTTNRAMIPVKPTSLANEWIVQLPVNLHISPQTESEPIQVQFIITQQLKAFPEEVTQHDPQLFLYQGNMVWYSPYETKWQQTRVRLPNTGSIESFSKPGQKQDRQIIYGAFENVPPKTVRTLSVHFESTSSMLIVTNLQRTVQVAPWSGKVHVEDWVDVWHSGSKLKDAFSRYEYQKDPTDAPAAVKLLRARLPRSAHNVFYRDEIGNISTSTLRPRDQYLLAELRPRFPLFGGWKTHFRLGYSIPLDEVLSVSEQNQNVLRIPFFDRVHDDGLLILDANVRIYLPSGSSDIQVQLPFEVKKEPIRSELFYLDVVGRPVVTLSKQLLVSQHSQPLTLKYKYSQMWLLQEPALLLAALLTFIIAIFIYSRVDFRILRTKKLHSQ